MVKEEGDVLCWLYLDVCRSNSVGQVYGDSLLDGAFGFVGFVRAHGTLQGQKHSIRKRRQERLPAYWKHVAEH